MRKEEIALNTALAHYYSIKAYEAWNVSITCVTISLSFPNFSLKSYNSFLIILKFSYKW
jgi:hypothetical protein